MNLLKKTALTISVPLLALLTILTLTGAGQRFINGIDCNGQKATGLATPTVATDAATKGYVDDKTWSANTITSDTLSLNRLAGITDAQIATANKDGTAGTPSLRTLGNGAQQAVAGNDARLSDARTPTGSAGGDLGGTYPNPSLAALSPSPAGTFGSSSVIPVLTVDTKGRVTSVTTATPILPNVQEFTSSGTWTKPSGCSWWYAELKGPGGSSGGGARGATNGGGGGGGGGGSTMIASGVLSELPSTLAVTVGQPGTPGVGATAANTNGTAAAAGTATTWHIFKAVAGLPGSGGTTSAGGAAGSFTNNASGMFQSFGTQTHAGGAGGTAAPGTSAANTTNMIPTGGGGGGGASASNQSDGGTGGGLSATALTATINGALGGSKGVRSPSVGGTYAGNGLGGGGGCGSNTGSAGQSGAAGGFPGGGAGGGGGGYNAMNGGNGALGGGGFVRITCWLKRDLEARASKLDSFNLAL